MLLVCCCWLVVDVRCWWLLFAFVCRSLLSVRCLFCWFDVLVGRCLLFDVLLFVVVCCLLCVVCCLLVVCCLVVVCCL